MDAKDVIRTTIALSDRVINAYLDDLSDDDLKLRPVEGMNPIAWQLGHLILAERRFAEMIGPGASPPLPEGFDQAHGKDAATSPDPGAFLPKAGYLDLWKAQRQATLSVFEGLDAGRLDQPSGVPFAPTFGAILGLIGTHPLMHAGQFVAVRRALKKPVAI